MSIISKIDILHVVDATKPPDTDVVQDAVIVAVSDSEGAIGFGESQTSPHMLAAVLSAPANRAMRVGIKELVEGRPVGDPGDILTDLRAVTRVVGREGLVAHALSALEVALWDLRGRSCGEPVWKMLPKSVNDGAGPCAYGTTWFSSSEADLEASASAVRDQSLVGLKVAYPSRGVPDLATEARALRWLRGNMSPDSGLYVDWQSQGTVPDLEQRLDLYEEVGLGWIEEPFDRDNFAAYETLAGASPVPIAAAESETRLVGFKAFIDAGVTILQPDLGRCGLQLASQVADLCRSAGLSVVPHQWGSNLNRASNVHWAFAEGLELTERRLDAAPLLDSLISWDAPVEAKRYLHPSSPGLGVVVPSESFERLC